MKKFKIIYKNYATNKMFTTLINAETQEDARDYFFKHKSGMLLRVEFVDYV